MDFFSDVVYARILLLCSFLQTFYCRFYTKPEYHRDTTEEDFIVFYLGLPDKDLLFHSETSTLLLQLSSHYERYRVMASFFILETLCNC